MKVWKTMLVLLCCNFAFHAGAQFQKGSILLEGNAGYKLDFKNKGQGSGFKTPYQVNIGMQGGYFLNVGNEIGIGLDWGKSRSYISYYDPFLNQFTQRNSYIANSLYWRHYTPIGGGRLLFAYSVGASALFSQFTGRDFATGEETRYSATNLRIGLSPSLVYMLNSKIGLRGNFGSLGFDFYKPENDKYWSNSFSLNFSPQSLNFGLFFVLNGVEANQ